MSSAVGSAFSKIGSKFGGSNGGDASDTGLSDISDDMGRGGPTGGKKALGVLKAAGLGATKGLQDRAQGQGSGAYQMPQIDYGPQQAPPSPYSRRFLRLTRRRPRLPSRPPAPLSN